MYRICIIFATSQKGFSLSGVDKSFPTLPDIFLLPHHNGGLAHPQTWPIIRMAMPYYAIRMASIFAYYMSYVWQCHTITYVLHAYLHITTVMFTCAKKLFCCAEYEKNIRTISRRICKSEYTKTILQ